MVRYHGMVGIVAQGANAYKLISTMLFPTYTSHCQSLHQPMSNHRTFLVLLQYMKVS